MAAPHKAAWDGLTLDTSLSVTQLVNMIHQSALESTGDIEHGRFRLHLEHETPLESEWRVAGYANSLEKFLVFTLQLTARAGRTELTSTITWYVTHKEPGKGIFAGKTVVMSAHHVYMQFLRNLAQQTLAADPGARVDIRDIDQGVPADPGAGAPPPPPISTGLPTGQPLPPPPPPGPSLAPPSPPSLLAGRVLVPPPPPPPGPSLGPPPLAPGLPLGRVPAASIGTPLPPVARRLGRLDGGDGLVTSVPGIGTRATDPNAPPVVPPPLPARASAAPPPLPPAMPLSPAQPTPPSPTPLSSTPPSVPRDTTMGTWHPGFDDDARTALEAEAELNSNDNTMLGVPGNSSNRTLELHVEGREPIPLLGPIVLGRDPVAPSISISAHPTPLEDPAMSLSKTHTLIEPSAAGATITDLHSTNGTFLLLDGGQDERLEPGVARHLEVGQPIRIGKLRVQLYRR